MGVLIMRRFITRHPHHTLLIASLLSALCSCKEPTKINYACTSDSDCETLGLVCSQKTLLCIEEDSPFCGDGIVQANESCDPQVKNSFNTCDYGEMNCEQCTDMCTLITISANPRCGDGKVQKEYGEECDAGQSASTQCKYGERSCMVCSDRCTQVSGEVSFCGDGIKQINEVCDAGPNPPQGCNAGERSCQLCNSSCELYEYTEPTSCGDGYKEGDEQCDPGPDPDLDCAYGDTGCEVCSPQCTWQEGADHGHCGDGVIQSAYETCDGSIDTMLQNCENRTHSAYGALRCEYCQIEDDSCTRAVSVAPGFAHTCAVLDDESLHCWGANGRGQLGTSLDGGANIAFIPVRVDLPRGARQVVTGAEHTCVLTRDNAVFCWGANHKGQVGGGSLHDALSYDEPVAVILPTDVQITKLAAGTRHTCALSTEGELYCWGDNSTGALGQSRSQMPFTSTPIVVKQDVIIEVMALHGDSTCLAHTAGVECAGKIAQPDEDEASIEGFMAITNTAHVRQLTLGQEHLCMTNSQRVARCWGKNDQGQLGNPTALLRDGAGPSLVKTISGDELTHVNAIFAGAVHTCARTDNGSIHCWGDNRQAQFGGGVRTNFNVDVAQPIIALDNDEVTDMAFGSQHACLLGKYGIVKCWGKDGEGQLGNGTNPPTDTPEGVSIVP